MAPGSAEQRYALDRPGQVHTSIAARIDASP